MSYVRTQVVEMVILHWRKQAWLLKNSFQSVSTTNFVRKLLSLHSLEGLKFTEITALVPFSTATGDYTHNPAFPKTSRFSFAPTD